MLNADSSGTSPSRRVDHGNRFVAFTFAASEMVVEVDAQGLITYAAGAFRSRMGSLPEAFLGRSITELVAPCDKDALEIALMLVQERGRLLPRTVRLANSTRSAAVLAGLKLTPDSPASPVCLTLGLPPAAAALISQATTAQQLAHAAQVHIGSGKIGHMALLELRDDGSGGEALAFALEQLAPDTLASEVAPGRYGLLSTMGQDVNEILPSLEATLLQQNGISISSRQVALTGHGLMPMPAARALRHALATFARDGTGGIDEAGFGTGLAGYVQRAMQQADVLRKAIAQRDFTFLFQPIVSLKSRKLHHYEALLRPCRSIASHTPQGFVSLVETVGVAEELDMAVLTMVCEAAERYSASVAVNVSGHSVQDPGSRTKLLDLLGASRAARDGHILVEMTETAAVENLVEVAETASSLRRLGVKFCIDDFGAGAADIRLLRATPTDIVKLDGSFVSGIIGEGRQRAFVTGMVEIAHAVGAAVVAERIETEAEAEALAVVGAQLGQGWLFGRPGLLQDPTVIRPARRGGTQESWG